MVEIAEHVLIRAAREGDVEAFEELVRRHQAVVYRIALRLLGSEADAQDATQDTFVRAWRSVGRFRSESTFSTWLYRIVTRRCFDLMKTRRPTATLNADEVDASADPPEVVERRERLCAVTRAIAALPAEQRAALVLREFEGLSYEEISEALDITMPAVKGRIHRARLAVLEQQVAWR